MLRTWMALLLLVTVAANAQGPRYSEQIEVRLIQVEAVVTDRQGNRVHGLTADDFEIFEGRHAQKITNFTEYRSDAAGRTDGVPPSAPVQASAASPAVAQPEPHTLLVLIDSMPPSIRARAFESLEKLLAERMSEGDRAGIVFWSAGYDRPVVVCEPTSDTAAVLNAVRGLAGDKRPTGGLEQALVSEAPSEVTSAAREIRRAGPVDIGVHLPSFSMDIEEFFFRRKANAIRRLITSLGASRGRKSLLYVSNRFGRSAAFDDLIKTANAAGVTFYGVRPAMSEELRTAEPATYQEASATVASSRAEFDAALLALGRLAEATGGAIDFGPTSVESIGKKVREDFDSYYSIAYQAESNGRDRERRITVKTKNRAYRVRSRESFVEKSNETLARDAVVMRLFSDQERDDLGFELKQGPARRIRDNRWLLPVTLTIPTKQLRFTPEGSDRVARLKILVQAANNIGEVANMVEQDLRIPAGNRAAQGVVTWSAKLLFERRGSIVSIGVMDRSSGLVGVQTVDMRGQLH